MGVQATAGVDTWAVCWRIHEDSDAAAMIEERATVKVARGAMLPEAIEGHRTMWFPGRTGGLLAAEGHPAGEGRLATPDGLPGALRTLQGALERELEADLPDPKRFGYSEHGLEGVKRLDTAVNLQWDGDRAEGLGLLAGLASIAPPGRLQPVIRRRPGGGPYETVAWQGTRGILARAYDKGVESNLAARGQLVRLEDQRRWPSGARRDVEELTADYVRETWQRRFVPLWRATKGLRVVTDVKLARELQKAVHEGRCTPGQAIDVMGHLLFERAGVHVGHRQTQWRHRKKARELGLVLADDGILQGEVAEELEVDVEGLMEAAFDDATWEPGRG